MYRVFKLPVLSHVGHLPFLSLAFNPQIIGISKLFSTIIYLPMMLLNKINFLLVSALGAASCVSAAANVAQGISDMNNMGEKIGAAKRSLDNYSGGIPAALGVARSLIVAQTSARTARENLAGDDKMTPEEGSRYAESYYQMSPILLGAIQSAQEKAPLFKKSGLGPEARTYLNNLHAEKRLFENQAKATLPDETFRKIQPSSDRISKAFDDADRAFQ
ncbi:hypothetical protein N7510_009982 [Penicillium lagena]|uniref:uncharacterized protein n=1 Tax=Penicillium lagena TaxID=94218 RepID=UPI002541FC68|nr:uncharacterized protein N7510_009982 [Penicillium lagena]KAJ5604828.1 hypothetical protein N7510_009982 [Penicillium lagena]